MQSRTADTAASDTTGGRHRRGAVRHHGSVRALHVETFGPVDGRPVLALHGLTGHGRRWHRLAADLPGHRIIAPDLLGHGHSPWEPPWHLEEHVDALVPLVDGLDQPPILVGHSFGGLLAVHLSRRVPVHALVLLDPAIAVPGHKVLPGVTHTVTHWTMRDAQHAREVKRAESWWEVADDLLDIEIEQHLVDYADGSPVTPDAEPDGVGWRVSVAATAGMFGELCRPFELPPRDIPIHLVQALKVQPPYVAADFVAALRTQQGDLFTLHEIDCDHMVPLARPDLVADLVTRVG